ncbi:GNAT family N-acetyltransferase [Fulvivirga sp. 29W222]|uniref:GNAT family N-acetyltransferase n=1 Tax=Fulvivirga marina TaxID=2494733 RepID=A0A937KAD7_9BACT|nr:GNAT family N-acetyltransferase [Fulvivirga marina]MBL6445216.1 GNAT family N-acetyltransferase [Fulvivirga marina]
MTDELIIRAAKSRDVDQIWDIIHKVIKSGDSYAFAPDSSKEKMLAYWMAEKMYTYVAEYQKSIVGTFFITDNQPGLGSHVANAGYMVHPNLRGLGLGKKLGQFSIKEAKRLGYHALQFNFVVKSNITAISLWKSLDFQIVGEIPNAYQHQQSGLTNVYVLYREL